MKFKKNGSKLLESEKREENLYRSEEKKGKIFFLNFNK